MAATAAWRPSTLTVARREERRLVAARLFARGRRDLAEIARELGVSRQSVSRWFATWAEAGRAGLKARPKTGRRPEIDAAGWARLPSILSAGAMAAGFDTERWTLRRVAAVAERELGVRHHLRSYSRILRAHDWTPQRPAVQAWEWDEALCACHLTSEKPIAR